MHTEDSNTIHEVKYPMILFFFLIQILWYNFVWFSKLELQYNYTINIKLVFVFFHFNFHAKTTNEFVYDYFNRKDKCMHIAISF